MKQISTRFSIAVHILSVLAVSPVECTSELIAGSVNTNPVIIRKIIGMLKKARLVEVRPGVGGAALTRAPEAITLLDVYKAVEAADEERLFRIHEDSNERCPVGRSIERVLEAEMREVQAVMEARLARTTLDQLTRQFGEA